MLVILRKEKQKIIIKCPDGQLIEVSLNYVKDKNKAYIGINAPKEYKIDREEKIKKEPEVCLN